MPAQRKVFRIEENLHASIRGETPVVSADDEAAQRHHELMTEIMAMRALLNARSSPRPASARETRRIAHDNIGQSQISQAHELKGELDLIHEAIRRTKQDIGGFEGSDFFGPQMARVGRELDAVVSGTEQATEKILKSAEDIDQIANSMSSLLKGDYARGLAQDVRDHVVKIFEACNFQDLTGQRIGKVLSTLKFIEEHIDRMQDIWRDIERVVPAPPAAPRDAGGESKLLNGPKLEGDSGHASQADIDVIFDSN
jgi:chemotaxis protein CheZ